MKPEVIDVVWPTQEIVYSNRADCDYLRINFCCVNDENPLNGTKDSCQKNMCPIRLV